MRSDLKKSIRNLGIKSELKTLARNLEQLIQAKKLEQALKDFRKFSTRLDKAVGKKILHRNTASRKKSRFARILAKLSAA